MNFDSSLAVGGELRKIDKLVFYVKMGELCKWDEKVKCVNENNSVNHDKK